MHTHTHTPYTLPFQMRYLRFAFVSANMHTQHAHTQYKLYTQNTHTHIQPIHTYKYTHTHTTNTHIHYTHITISNDVFKIHFFVCQYAHRKATHTHTRAHTQYTHTLSYQMPYLRFLKYIHAYMRTCVHTYIISKTSFERDLFAIDHLSLLTADMYVCMYVCACVYVCMCVCMYVCM